MGIERLDTMSIPQENPEKIKTPEENKSDQYIPPVEVVGNIAEREEREKTDTLRLEEVRTSLGLLTPEEKTPEFTEQIDGFANKLSEQIIGLRINDPALPDRLIEDQKIIRAKYSLPKLEARGNLDEYERDLLDIAKSTGVTIKSKSECGQFFNDYSYVGGVNFEKENKIGVDIDKTDSKSYSKSLGILEHELIHALQNKYHPRMPIEQMEYEAYIAGGNNELIKEHPEIAKLVFENLIGTSVKHWYEQNRKEK